MAVIDKQRKMSERSLENLKLGASARRQGKERHNYTILPESHEWLERGGNASRRIDELVLAAKRGDLKSNHVYDAIEAIQQVSIDEYNQIKSDLEQAQAQIEALKRENAELRNTAELNYEATRDRVLDGLKLGSQAPEYKRVNKVLNRFIALVKQT